MSKISQYLQSHIQGEVSTRLDVRESVAKDSGALTMRPDMVVYPRSMSDVRKVIRFALQLAEKKHAVGLIPRGSGTDNTGSAIGRGIAMVLSRHMNAIYEYDAKQKLLRLQSGAKITSVQSALRLHGVAIPALNLSDEGTIGGAVAVDASGRLSGKFGSVRRWVEQIEVILDNGEVLQTGRISRKELEKIKGQPGRIADIYRGIETIIEDNAELIELMKQETLPDKSGYPGIAEVVGKNGSFDLLPLFIGSQGTLGVIVEMIVRGEFVPHEPVAVAAVFKTAQDARDAADQLARLDPVVLEYFDGIFLKSAAESGKSYSWIKNEVTTYGAALELEFHEFSDGKKHKIIKKVTKILEKYDCDIISTQDASLHDVLAARHSLSLMTTPPDHNDRAALSLTSGFYVNPQRFDEFTKELLNLSEALKIDLPIHGSILKSIYAVAPTFSMQKTADKQKLLKLLDQLTVLVAKYDGAIVGDGSEGRLLSRFARASWSEEYEKMMDDIKKVFDPNNILNPNVKASIELRDLVAMLRADNTSNLIR